MIRTTEFEVRGLPAQLDSCMVRDRLSKFGIVLRVRVLTPRVYVTFDSDRCNLEAIKNNQQDLQFRIPPKPENYDFQSIIPYAGFTGILVGYPQTEENKLQMALTQSINQAGLICFYQHSNKLRYYFSNKGEYYKIEMDTKIILQIQIAPQKDKNILFIRLRRPPKFFYNQKLTNRKNKFPFWTIGVFKEKFYYRTENIFEGFKDLMIFNIKNLVVGLKIPKKWENSLFSCLQYKLNQMNIQKLIKKKPFLLKQQLENSGLPHKIIMFIYAILSTGYASATQLDLQYLQYLKTKDLTRLEKALEWLYSYRPPFNIEEIPNMRLLIQEAYQRNFSIPVQQREGFTAIWKVLVTPTTVYIKPGDYQRSNRVIRHFPDYTDNFLRVSFVQQNQNLIVPYPYSLLKRVQQFIKRLSLAGKTYKILAFSASQLRTHSVWMLHTQNSVSPKSIRNWLGDFSNIKFSSKYCARVGQAFSSTRKIMDINEDEIQHIKDIQRPYTYLDKKGNQVSDKYNFTDGIGKISQELVWEIQRKTNSKSIAFQFRMGGLKGVVCLDDTLQGRKIQIRPSMNKFKSTHLQFQLVNQAKYNQAYLNRQIIMLLSTLGVPDQAFIELQDSMIQNLESQIIPQTISFLKAQQVDNIAIQSITELLHLKQQPIIQTLNNLVRVNLLEGLLKKQQIVVQKSGLLMGVVDQKNLLDYGQCYFQVNETVITGTVVIAKNPCLHPGDVRILEAVNCPQLIHQQNVLVFPARGPRPHPNECSGSDLDGDLYFVSWDQRLIPSRIDEPMKYDQEQSVQQNPPFTPNHMINFFKLFITNDKLGQIDNSHLALADISDLYASDPRCIELCKLHGIAVDFAKNGIKVQIPKQCIPQSYPDFMNKKNCQVHQSKKVLGKLFREANQYYQNYLDYNQQPFNFSQLNPEFLAEGYENYLEEASRLFNQYQQDIKIFLYQFKIKSEIEFLIGYPLYNSKIFSKRKRRQEEVYTLFTYLANQVIEKYKNLFEKSPSRPLASALYEISTSANHFCFPWVVAKDFLLQMGQANCSNCTCTHKESEWTEEFDFKQQEKNENESIVTDIPRHSPKNTDFLLSQIATVNQTTKIQAVVRRFLATQLCRHYSETKEKYIGFLADYNSKKEPQNENKAFTFASGAIYVGSWEGQNRHGFGTQTWPDGAKYEGMWEDNKAHGHGIFKHTDGDVYQGNWAEEKANGKGVYSHMNGARYEGDWKSDLQQGFGEELWADGSKYTGFYMNGKKHGFGIYQWSDGSQFVGQWHQNRINGKGKYTWLDGRSYEGEWLNNNMHGFGIYKWKDGRMYKGEYKFDKKHGQGQYVWADGKKYIGGWKNGKQDGEGLHILPGGEAKKSLWQDGRRVKTLD